MRFMARVFFLAAFAVAMAFPAFAAEGGYLFESNIAKFKDIKKVSSRSYKFLTVFDATKDLKTNILAIKETVIKAAKTQGYDYQARKKGDEWRFSEKRYYDTPNKDLYKKGYVVRENYRFNEGEKLNPEKFVLTVKEMSPDDFARLTASKLGPVPGSDSLVKFEENTSISNNGRLQSYFESAIGSRVSNKDLGQRTLGDYGKLYPELLNLGIPATTKLVAVVGYSVQLKFGAFKLPGGAQAKMDIEMWSATPGGKPVVAEVAFDTSGDEGYDTPTAELKAAEDFFLKVFGKGMRAMPNGGQYMGSKVRVLFDAKYDGKK